MSLFNLNNKVITANIIIILYSLHKFVAVVKQLYNNYVDYVYNVSSVYNILVIQYVLAMSA